MLLSDKYWDFVDYKARAEFLEGTTASGKTTTVGLKFIMNVAESDMTLHVIAGKTAGIVEKNIINADYGLKQIFPNLRYCGNGDGENKLAHIKLDYNGKKKIIYVLGYNNADTWKNVLGSQFGCVWVDEINTANIEFVREVFGRSKWFVGTLNPDDPHLPIYEEYVNLSTPVEQYAGDIPPEILRELKPDHSRDWAYWFFGFVDNISLSEEQIAEKRLSYPVGTKIYKNKVLGLRGKATGLVFCNFSENIHVVSSKTVQDIEFDIYSAGLDTSYSSNSADTIAMTFLGIRDGIAVVLAEKVYNNRDLDTPIAPSDTVINFIDFLEENRKKYGFARDTFIDSADQATIKECIKYKAQHPDCLYNFNNAWKKLQIIDRINLQLGWLSHEDDKIPKFYVVNTCKNLISEFNSYSWREDKNNEPEDRNDHLINSQQYAWIPYIKKIGGE